ncbi:MAG TPA: hypothetical protein VIY73_27300 [Polyangiaceae bacterium]
MTDLRRFDQSFAAVTSGLHLGTIAACALAGTFALYVWREYRGRARWSEVPVAVIRTTVNPYRSSSVVTARLRRAPALVRAACFASFFVAHACAPLLLLAFTRFPFDGVSIPLIPGLAIVAANWFSGWLLLGGSPAAAAAARTAAKASLFANVGLLGLAAAHLAMVELGRREGIEHACSASVTFVALVFAVVSILQAVLVLVAHRAHGAALRSAAELTGG